MNIELRQAATWLSDYRLTLNLKKTKAMFFGTGAKLKQINTTQMNFSGVNIDVVDCYKYLGIMLDSQLRFSKHVAYLQSKIWPKMKTLARVRCYIGKTTALYLYNTLPPVQF